MKKPKFFAHFRYPKNGLMVTDFYTTNKWPFYHETRQIEPSMVKWHLLDFSTRVKEHRNEDR